MKIDIILPVYKANKQWLIEAIHSVLNQTYTNWYLTIIDDASPDDTVQHIKAFCSSYPKQINLIRLKQNRRAAGARMEAISRTDGDVIAFLDQDDHWKPQKLQKQIERFYVRPEVQAVHTGVVHIDVEGKLLPGKADEENFQRTQIPYDHLSNKELSQSIFLNNSIRLVSSAILRKAFVSVGGFNKALFGGEDWEFWVRFSNRCRIGYLSEPLVERRIHNKNTSAYFHHSRSLGLLDALDLVEGAYPHLKPLADQRRSHLLGRALMAELKCYRHVKACRYAWLLVQLKPIDVRTWLLLGLLCTGSYSSLILKTCKWFKFKVCKIVRS